MLSGIENLIEWDKEIRKKITNGTIQPHFNG